MNPLRERYVKGKKQTVEKQLYEIIKYSIKPWELPPLKLIELWGALKGKRRVTKAGIFTNNKASQKEWRKRLEGCGLLEEWDRIRGVGIDEPDEEKQLIETRYFEVVYHRHGSKYTEEERGLDYTHQAQPFYEEYQKNKGRILGEYNSAKHRHLVGLKLARMFGKLSYDERIIWIEKKEMIKSIMREQIYNETDIVRAKIISYRKAKREGMAKDRLQYAKENCYSSYTQGDMFGSSPN